MALSTAADYKLTDVSRATIAGRPFHLREGAARYLMKSEDIAFLAEGLRERCNILRDYWPDVRLPDETRREPYAIPETFDIASRYGVAKLRNAVNDVTSAHWLGQSGQQRQGFIDEDTGVYDYFFQGGRVMRAFNDGYLWKMLDLPEASAFVRPIEYPAAASPIATVDEMAAFYRELARRDRFLLPVDERAGSFQRVLFQGSPESILYGERKEHYDQAKGYYDVDYERVEGYAADYLRVYGGKDGSSYRTKPTVYTSYRYNNVSENFGIQTYMGVNTRIKDLYAIVRHLVTGYKYDGTSIGGEFWWRRLPWGDVNKWSGFGSISENYRDEFFKYYGYGEGALNWRNWQVWENGGIRIETKLVAVEFKFDYRAQVPREF